MGKSSARPIFVHDGCAVCLYVDVRLVSCGEGGYCRPAARLLCQTYSLSPAVLEHHRELLMCASGCSPSTLEPPSGLQNMFHHSQHSQDSLVLLLTNKRYSQALQAIRQLRSAYGGEYGCCETVDIDVLLLLFCRSHSLKAWAIVGSSGEEMSRQSELLREVNADMASCIRRAQMEDRPMARTTPSTMSSTTESFANISSLPDHAFP
ncbi:unnamed protein product [Caenorhabditis auriculariae]|uniref:Protein furry C-terminal domain-containing protein n=1 Tax=Caenorhabditis auriculariae TaxID=2777116 RepID=A0A8S1H169_9PELO|nr:unnamed protein product [Caenorhabditis auriculariae]